MALVVWFEKGARVMLEPDLRLTFGEVWYRDHKDEVGTVAALPSADVRTVRWPDGSEKDLHIDQLVNA